MKKLTNEQRANRIRRNHAMKNWALAALFFAPVSAWTGVGMWSRMENRNPARNAQVEVVKTMTAGERLSIKHDICREKLDAAQGDKAALAAAWKECQ